MHKLWNEEPALFSVLNLIKAKNETFKNAIL